MRLNHLNLAVTDVAESKGFFEKYFGFQQLLERPNLAVLHDSGGFVLTLNHFGGEAEAAYPKAFHIGFIQKTRQDVDTLFERLKSDGYEPPAPREFHGAWTFDFTAPGGFQIEVLHQPGAPTQD